MMLRDRHGLKFWLLFLAVHWAIIPAPVNVLGNSILLELGV